jgi:putative ABC transport system permease protein
MAAYLGFKEVWRNRGRFFLFSLVIALITVLVLFIAGLAEGLANANREYLANLDGELIVFQADTKLSTTASRIGPRTVTQTRRVDGVAAAGPVGLSNATLVFTDGREDVDISLVGYEPGKPGGAQALQGRNLRSSRAFETVIDANLAKQSSVAVGDTIILKSIQGTEDEFYKLEVVGISDGRQYFFAPSIFVSTEVWDQVRPQGEPGNVEGEITYNILAVKLQDPNQIEYTARLIEARVDDVEVADRVTAYESTPGYQAQQSTLNTQRGFTFLIGVLVIGGFFQIQTLQKVPNIGMLKAVGASNPTVGTSVVLQILAVTVFGVLIGSVGTLSLALGLPDGIPIQFTQQSLLVAMSSLLVIGPLGGLVSVRLALRVEPLQALGLNS